MLQKEKFVPGLSYVVARAFTFGGVELKPGDPVPGADDRRLEQLYRQGHLAVRAGSDARQPVARRAITLSGVTYAPGKTVPRTAFASEHRLEQLVRRGDVRRGDVRLGEARSSAARAQPRRALRRATSRRAAAGG